MRKPLTIFIVAVCVIVGSVGIYAFSQKNRQTTYEPTSKEQAMLRVEGIELSEEVLVSYDSTSKTIIVNGTVVNTAGISRKLVVNAVMRDTETQNVVLAFSGNVITEEVSVPLSFVLTHQNAQPIDFANIETTLAVVAAE